MGWLCLSTTCNGMLPEAAWNNCGNFAHKIRLRHQVQRTSPSGGTLATGQLQRGGRGRAMDALRLIMLYMAYRAFFMLLAVRLEAVRAPLQN